MALPDVAPAELTVRDRLAQGFQKAAEELGGGIRQSPESLADAALHTLGVLRSFHAKYPSREFVPSELMLRCADIASFRHLGINRLPQEPLNAVLLWNSRGTKSGFGSRATQTISLFRTEYPPINGRPSSPRDSERGWLRGLEVAIADVRVGDVTPVRFYDPLERKPRPVHTTGEVVLASGLRVR